MKYFELNDDIYFPSRWYLGEVSGINNWGFLSGNVECSSSDVVLNLVESGEALDFTFTETYRVPIVSQKLKGILQEVNGVEFMELNRFVGSHEIFYALIITNFKDCVDESRSQYEKYEDGNLIRPDKVGEYRSFFEMRLDATKIGNVQIFRLENYKTSIIVSEDLKEIIEKNNLCGVSFKDVS